MPIDEQTLISRLLEERHALIAYVWSITRSYHVAEDVFQEVSLLAVRKREMIASEEHIWPWLKTAARFEALKHRDASARGPALMDDSVLGLLDNAWDRQAEGRSRDVMDALERCVAKLTPNARRLLDARYGQGQSGMEIARVVGRKVESVYQALSRIHATLAQCIRRHTNGEGGRQ